MCPGSRAESGSRRYQSIVVQREDAILARIDQDRALSPRRAKGGGDEHPGRNQGAQRVHVSANRNRDGFSRHGRALGQVSGEADGLAIMPGTRGIGQLRSLS